MKKILVNVAFFLSVLSGSAAHGGEISGMFVGEQENISIEGHAEEVDNKVDFSPSSKSWVDSFDLIVAEIAESKEGTIRASFTGIEGLSPEAEVVFHYVNTVESDNELLSALLPDGRLFTWYRK